MSKKLFDFAIGNPPYNSEFSKEGNATYAAPVYNNFIDVAIDVADKVELVHPARFLFNAGSTPKAWNKKMLNDPHFKVLHFEMDSKKIFNNTDIKGGIAITYRDADSDYGAIETFTPYEHLNSVMHKVVKASDFESIKSCVVSSYSYHFTEQMHRENPSAKERMSKGHEFDLKSNVFDKLDDVFHIEKESNEDYCVLGRINNKRDYRYISKSYIKEICNTEFYKIAIAAANGDGSLGNIAAPVLCSPHTITTESFLTIGSFDSKVDAENLEKYLKTRFFRAMLGILKVTQHITPEVFRYVPTQDFTSNSDINWNTSIKNIDKQLYKKYGLSDEEIDFIETNVKEME